MKTRLLVLFDHCVYYFVFLSAFKIRKKRKILTTKNIADIAAT